MKVIYNSLLLRCFNCFYLTKAQVLVEWKIILFTYNFKTR